MSIAATVGEPCILAIEACIHDGFVAFDQHDNHMTADFLARQLRLLQVHFRSQGQTGTQVNLNTSIVGGSFVRVPSLKEQHRIIEILDAHGARIRVEEAYRDKLRLQKKGLMDDLLTGRVRVKAAQEVGS